MSKGHPDQVPLLIFDKKQIEAIASVACSDVYSALSSVVPKSKRELGKELGKSPASVGPHVDKLVKVGIAINAGQRKRRSRIESLYLLKAQTARFQIEGLGKTAVKNYQKRIKAQMRLFERQIEAFQDAVADDSTLGVYLTYKWRHVHVSPDGAIKIKNAIQDLVDMVARLAETDLEAIERNEFVRVSVAGLMAPTLSESKRLSK